MSDSESIRVKPIRDIVFLQLPLGCDIFQKMRKRLDKLYLSFLNINFINKILIVIHIITIVGYESQQVHMVIVK